MGCQKPTFMHTVYGGYKRAKLRIEICMFGPVGDIATHISPAFEPPHICHGPHGVSIAPYYLPGTQFERACQFAHRKSRKKNDDADPVLTVYPIVTIDGFAKAKIPCDSKRGRA